MLRTYFSVTVECRKNLAPHHFLPKKGAFKNKKAATETIVEINEELRALANPQFVIVSLQSEEPARAD